MDVTFLGTGAAWRVPELNCECLICQEMRGKNEKRDRTALLLRDKTNLLVDCGPDIVSQLTRHHADRIDGVLISHEHGDHYMGLDELFAYKRNSQRGTFSPIPVYATAQSWEVIGLRFKYLEDMGVIKALTIQPGIWFNHEEFEILPFRTDHGTFAKGCVGFLIQRDKVRLLYTSDFKDIPECAEGLLYPDYLVIQSFWMNEPVNNRPSHMSFQRAIGFIDMLKPKTETFLVHIGDADMVPGDPANGLAKKYEPKDPLRSPSGGDPYPIPLNQEQWQRTIERILSDRGLTYKVTVAQDDLCVRV